MRSYGGSGGVTLCSIIFLRTWSKTCRAFATKEPRWTPIAPPLQPRSGTAHITRACWHMLTPLPPPWPDLTSRPKTRVFDPNISSARSTPISLNAGQAQGLAPGLCHQVCPRLSGAPKSLSLSLLSLSPPGMLDPHRNLRKPVAFVGTTE